MNDELILIGEIVSAVGIKGEVKVKSYAESPDNYKSFGYVFIEEKGEYQIERARSSGNMVVLKLDCINDRNEAEGLVKNKLYIEEKQLEDLPEDTYYVRDLIGLKVIDVRTSEAMGEVKDVLQNGPQDVYVIAPYETEGNDGKKTKEVLVPAVKEFIKNVDIENGKISIEFIEGML